MKKKQFVLIVVLAVVMSLFSFAAASAATNTGIDVVNLSGTAGNVVVEFFDATGASQGTVSDSISAFGSLNFYIPAISLSLSSGQYSAVVSSEVPVAATVGLTDGTERLGDNYLGTDSPSAELSFPLIYRNYGGWTSQLVVQNATSSQQTVNIEFFKNGSTTANATDSAVVPAFSYAVFDMADAAYAAFGNDFGGASVTGAGNLAGTALAIRDKGTGPAAKAELIYRAFSAEQQAQEILLPLFYKNFSRFQSGINVVNRGTAATNVTVEYTSSNGVAGGPWTASKTGLQPGEMYTFYNPASVPNGVYGSARVSSTAADIAVVVSSSRTDGTGNNQSFAYEGAVATSATPCVALPIVHNRTSWKSGINILNLGSSAASVDISYSSSNPSTPNATKTYSVPAGAPLTVYMPTDAATAVNFYGGASLSSTENILVLATHANSNAGISQNYMGVNFTCPTP